MDYNDLVSELKSSQVQDYQPDPVLTEKVNDYAIFGKNFLGATGGMLEGEAIKKTFKQLSKQGSEGLLNQLDLNDEDMEDLIGKISSGDTEGVASVVAQRGINIARNKLGSFVRDTKGSAKKLYQSLKAKATGRQAPPSEEDVGEPASASEVTSEPATVDLPFPEVGVGDYGVGLSDIPVAQAIERSLGGSQGTVQSEDGTLRIGTQAPADPSPLAQDTTPETQLTDNVEMQSNTMKASGSQRSADSEVDKSAEDDLGDVGGGGDGGAEASSIGSKVEKGLDELTADSEAFDESPIGIGVTALLGVASLVSGIFIKTHKDKFTRPPLPHQMATSYAVEKGIF